MQTAVITIEQIEDNQVLVQVELDPKIERGKETALQCLCVAATRAAAAVVAGDAGVMMEIAARIDAEGGAE